MIIWRGLGILVLLCLLGCLWEAQSLADAKFGAHYTLEHLWVGGIAAICTAAVCFVLGWLFRSRNAKGKTNTRGSHHLFFIPIIWWSPILAVLGVGMVVYDYHEFMAKVTSIL